ncbi:MAG: RDD family protein [Thermodesulfobacteriota bacterium]
MKCPSCGYNSFDHLEHCKKCGFPLYTGTAPLTQETGKKAGRKSRGRSEKPSGDPLTGELFLDIPIRDADAPLRTESGKPGPSGRRRTSARADGPPAESYELFPASKDVEAGKYGGERPQDLSPGASYKAPLKERDTSDTHNDPFAFIEGGDAYYEPYGDKGAESYARDTDVYNLAGFVSRALALIIDILIVSLIALLAVFAGLFVVYGFDFGAYGSGNIIQPLYAVLFLLSSTYFVFFHGYGGKTVGKTVMGIKLMNSEGEGVGLWESFVRWVGYYISGAFLFAGFLWFLVDSECQTWHDKIAGTYVVKD